MRNKELILTGLLIALALLLFAKNTYTGRGIDHPGSLGYVTNEDVNKDGILDLTINFKSSSYPHNCKMILINTNYKNTGYDNIYSLSYNSC